jgi:hypothetical protein
MEKGRVLSFKHLIAKRGILKLCRMLWLLTHLRAVAERWNDVQVLHLGADL